MYYVTLSSFSKRVFFCQTRGKFIHNRNMKQLTINHPSFHLDRSIFASKLLPQIWTFVVLFYSVFVVVIVMMFRLCLLKALGLHLVCVRTNRDTHVCAQRSTKSVQTY